MVKPVLLVHGPWTGAWVWDKVVDELDQRGVSATALDLPSRGTSSSLAEDARVVREAVAAIGGPVVLVGHSYAGMVITEASAGNDAVAHLVYVCAALPHEGETVSDLMSIDTAPTAIGEFLRTREDGTATVDPRGANDHIWGDVTDAEAAPALAAMGSHLMATFEDAAQGLGWQEHPSTYLLTTRDRIFSPELQRRMAQYADDVVEVEGSHGVMLSRPAQVADVIEEAASIEEAES